MGTKFAPSYATLVLAFLEEKLYKCVYQKYETEIAENIIHAFKRYLDDCFIIWKSTWGTIHEFHKLLNDMHPSIQFTIDINSIK